MKTMQKWFGVLMVLVALSGFVNSARAATPGIKQAVTARNYVGGLPVGVTSVFKPTQRKIYGVIIFDRIFTGDVRSVWTAVAAQGVAPNYKILEKSTGKMRLDRANFSVELPRNWPKGRYKLDIYLDGKKIRTLYYRVQ